MQNILTYTNVTEIQNKLATSAKGERIAGDIQKKNLPIQINQIQTKTLLWLPLTPPHHLP